MALTKMFAKSDSTDFNQVLGNSVTGLLSNIIFTNESEDEAILKLRSQDGMLYAIKKVPSKDTEVIKLEAILDNERIIFESNQIDCYCSTQLLQN